MTTRTFATPSRPILRAAGALGVASLLTVGAAMLPTTSPLPVAPATAIPLRGATSPAADAADLPTPVPLPGGVERSGAPTVDVNPAYADTTKGYTFGHVPVPMTEHTATSADGTPIAWQDYGKPRGTAPTVVLLHGYPNTSAVFYGILPALAEKYHVITIDTRGSGKSGHPRDVAAYDMTRLVEDTTAVLNDGAPGEKVHLVGHDFGAFIGWEQLRTPEGRARIASFTTFGVPSFEHWAQWTRDRLAPGDQPFGILDVASQMIRIPEFWGFLIPGVPELSWAANTFDAVVNYLNRVSGEPREQNYSRADGYAQSKMYTANFGTRIERPTYDLSTGQPGAAELPPILSLHGSTDRFFNQDFSASMDRFVSVDRRWIDSGHWSLVSDPDLVSYELLDFLGGIDD